MHAVAGNGHVATFQKSGNVRGSRGGSHLSGHAKSKTWVNGQASLSSTASPAPEGRWERGRGSRTLKRAGRIGANVSNRGSRATSANLTEDEDEGFHAGPSYAGPSTFATFPATSNGVTKTWEELVKAREEERTRAIREGKMDDPNKRKRLEDVITIAGTCQDMCPEFERYRRERENNLDRWECILDENGKLTKKVDHQRAVKIYERGQGDKIIPSDLRPAPVLKRTLDYLFYDLIPRGGFEDTQAFVRDRSRAVRNDFTIQNDTGPIAMECHERCARFHLLSLHLLYGQKNFNRALEIQQLMNSLLSLKEFYDDQRASYESPNELEMRIYHRLGLIRDQHERNDRPPPHIAADPTFQLVTRFRAQVQVASSPITKTSPMRVSPEAMETFGELLGILHGRQSHVMMFLVACFLEHIFGPDTIDDFERIRGGLSIQDIIDGNSSQFNVSESTGEDNVDEEMYEGAGEEEQGDEMEAFIEDELDGEGQSGAELSVPQSDSASTNGFNSPSASQGITASKSAAGLFAAPSASAGQSVFSQIISSSSAPSIFGNASGSSAFGNAPNVFGSGPNVFGGAIFGQSTNAAEVSKPKQFASMLTVPTFNTPSHPPISSDTEVRKSLADAAPLDSNGDEDRLPPSQALRTPEKPPPFAPSKTESVLNPDASSFKPENLKASVSTPSLPANSRASLTPLRTDSLLQNAVDPNRRSLLSSIVSPGLTFPSPSQRASPWSFNTSTPTKHGQDSSNDSMLESPLAPPPLQRKGIISLPGTPTGSFSSTSIPMAGPSTPSTPYHFPGLQVNVSATTSSIPNPISPNTLLPRQTSSTASLQSFSAFSSPQLSGKSKFGDDEKDKSRPSKGKLIDQAYDFLSHSTIVKESFRRWKKKMKDTLEWKEACRRSEEYKHKLQQQSPSLGTNGSMASLPSSSSFKRQRSNSSMHESETRPSRRKKRVSKSSVEIRTDEELAERLMKNKELHERRWARDTFMQTLQSYIRDQYGHVPDNWLAWFCLNSDNERTAIWLDCKFDVPKRGLWLSESVVSLSVSQEKFERGYPGLLIFECKSLDAEEDELEKKYCVLDDLSRLREVMNSLQNTEYYLPSILFITWDAEGVHDDIVRTAIKHINSRELRSISAAKVSSDDPDAAFAESLSLLELDIQGELVESMALSDIMGGLGLRWSEHVSIWLDACSSDESFNWALYSYVLANYVGALNKLLDIAHALWDPATASQHVAIPPFSFSGERNDETVPSAILSWLSSPAFDSPLLSDIVSAMDLSLESETRALFDHLLRLAHLRLESCLNGVGSKAIPKSSLLQASEEFERALEEAQKKLGLVSSSLPRPVSRRRSLQEYSIDITDIGDSISQRTSPVNQKLSNGESQPRIILTTSSPSHEENGNDSLFNGPSSPTPSNAPSNASTTAQVTLQMLRSLSRDVLNAYGPKTNSSAHRRGRTSL